MKSNMRLLSRALSVGLSLALCAGMVAPAFAASFSDLQDAIDGNGGAEFTTDDGDTRYGYGWNDDENRYGVEAWDTEDGRNVQLNEEVRYEDGDNKSGIIIGEDQNVDLDLNGNDINGTAAGAGTPSADQVINVKDGGSLTLDDSQAEVTEDGAYESGKVTGGKTGVVNNGEFTMNDGAISGNVESAGVGGGVYNDGTFTMNGGSIDHNETGNGGGVFNAGKGTFTMTGGEITENKANGGKTPWSVRDGDGGGVYNNGGTFTMEGGTIDKNTAVNNGGGVYTKGDQFTMNGGTIDGNTATNNGGGVYADKGTVNVNGGAIDHNTATTGNGGGVYADKGTVNVSGGSIDHNTAANGGGVYANEGSLTMNDGAIDHNTAATGNGGGVYVNNGTFTMEGGTIDGNSTNVGFTHADYDGTEAPTQGGGVYVTGKNSKFDLSGGVISNNTAGEGGGVFITYNGKQKGSEDPKVEREYDFTMTGGEVSNNTAKFGEGGGIYIYGNAVIKSGKITGNRTETTHDLGGGGIYIESDGMLDLYNAIITNNTASGLGGGLAACVHGKTIVYVNNGAIIYGNSAEGQNTTGQGHITGKFPDGNGAFMDGHDLWENDEDFKKGAQDIFTASDKGEKNGSGVPGVIVGNQTLFGDANWTGYLFLYNEDGSLTKDENGDPVWTPVTMDDEGGFVYGNRLLGLTANPDPDTIAAAEAAAKDAVEDHVIISGNHSNTHGGGIGNNGTLTIGDKSPFEDDDTPDEVEGNKELEKVEGAPENSQDRDLKDGEFTFVLTDKDGNKYKGTNDKDGNIVIQLPEDYFTEKLKDMGDGTYEYTFTVTEEQTDDGTIIFDKSEYKVTITVKKETVTEPIVVGNVKDIKTEKYTAESVVITKDGEPVENITFTNKYTPTVIPPVTESKKDIPEEPVEEFEEPEIPLDEEPEEELEEPEIPLDEIPEEEELDEPDIPLSDVPQTGDISLAWYAALIVSVCGLAVLAMSKKREGIEG